MRESISTLLSAAFDGKPWYGDALMDQVSPLTPEQAASHPVPGKKSIWELLMHILAWRVFTIRKLDGEDGFEIELNSPEDFPALPEVSEANWQALLQQLKDSQKSLLDRFKAISEEKLGSPIPGRKYTYEHLLHGIVQHDCYHLGQIGMLKSLLK